MVIGLQARLCQGRYEDACSTPVASNHGTDYVPTMYRLRTDYVPTTYLWVHLQPVAMCTCTYPRSSTCTCTCTCAWHLHVLCMCTPGAAHRTSSARAPGRDRRAAPICMFTCMHACIQLEVEIAGQHLLHLYAFICMHAYTHGNTAGGGDRMEIAWRSHGLTERRWRGALWSRLTCNRRRRRLQP